MPQPLLPFDDPPAESHAASIRYQPSQEAINAIERLKAWLTDPRTGKMTPLGEETLYALEKALVEGRNGWLLKAEDMLEVLAIRNGQAQGDDIPGSHPPGDRDFQQTIEDLRDCLHERVVGKGR